MKFKVKKISVLVLLIRTITLIFSFFVKPQLIIVFNVARSHEKIRQTRSTKKKAHILYPNVGSSCSLCLLYVEVKCRRNILVCVYQRIYMNNNILNCCFFSYTRTTAGWRPLITGLHSSGVRALVL